MRTIDCVARGVLGLAFAACTGVAAAQQPEPFGIVRHDLVIDLPHQEAVFNVWFSATPDFATFDQVGRQATAFLFSLQQLDIRAFNRRVEGAREPVFPFVRVSSDEPESPNSAVARVVTAGDDRWGPVVATADLHQVGGRVSFRLPLTIFEDGRSGNPLWNDELFAVHYFLEAFRFGYTTYRLARGVATVGTVEAPLTVQQQELKNGNGKKRRVMIANVLARPGTEEDPSYFSPEFVDVGSVRFGPGRAQPIGDQLKDVNGDGIDDLVLTFMAADVGLTCIDKDVRLTGEIPSTGNFVPEGTVFVGRAALTPKPCN
jgi:hypothetical protein